MLTPSELLNGASQNYLPTSRLENSNVDIHIHTVVNSVAAPPNMSLPENNLNLSM